MHISSEAAVPELIEGLSVENDLNTRLQSAQLLAVAGPDSSDAIDPLMGLLDTDHQAMRVASIYALGAIGKAAVTPLLARLRTAGKREDANEKPATWSEGAIANAPID